MARGLLIAGALLLAATAVFHMKGHQSVSGWVEGGRGTILCRPEEGSTTQGGW